MLFRHNFDEGEKWIPLSDPCVCIVYIFPCLHCEVSGSFLPHPEDVRIRFIGVSQLSLSVCVRARVRVFVCLRCKYVLSI